MKRLVLFVGITGAAVSGIFVAPAMAAQQAPSGYAYFDDVYGNLVNGGSVREDQQGINACHGFAGSVTSGSKIMQNAGPYTITWYSGGGCSGSHYSVAPGNPTQYYSDGFGPVSYKIS